MTGIQKCSSSEQIASGGGGGLGFKALAMGSLTMLNKIWALFLLVFFCSFSLGGGHKDGNVDLGGLRREYDRVHCVKLPNSQYNIMLEKKTCVNCKILPI